MVGTDPRRTLAWLLRSTYPRSMGPWAPRFVVGIGVAMFVAAAIASTAAEAGDVQYLPPALLEPTPACHGNESVVSDFEVQWYSGQWRAAQEPSIYEASKSPSAATTTYRFTWLRTFHAPVIVRIDVDPRGRMRLTAKQLSGKGGYAPAMWLRRSGGGLPTANGAASCRRCRRPRFWT